MPDVKPFKLEGADGKLICGDRIDGTGRQLLFITGRQAPLRDRAMVDPRA